MWLQAAGLEAAAPTLAVFLQRRELVGAGVDRDNAAAVAGAAEVDFINFLVTGSISSLSAGSAF